MTAAFGVYLMLYDTIRALIDVYYRTGWVIQPRKRVEAYPLQRPLWALASIYPILNQI